MSLGWGHRPIRDSWRISGAQALFFLIGILAADVSSTPGPFVTRPANIIEADTPAQIQALLDAHRDAVERGDLFAYERTLDRRSTAFVRCMRDLFERGPARVAELEPERVIDVRRLGPSTLLRVQVRQRDGVAIQYVRRLLVVRFTALPPFDLRSTFVVWYISPPEEAELGYARRMGFDDVPHSCFTTTSISSLTSSTTESIDRFAGTAHVRVTRASRGGPDLGGRLSASRS